MKIIITGATGLLGRAIAKELEKEKTWEVICLGFNRIKDGITKIDLKDENAVKTLIEAHKPDVVIHSAAERRPDHVINNETETRKLNVSSTEILAKEMNKLGQFLLYISTDYVFDGTKPPYMVTSTPNPLNKYGETKLEGEQAIQKHCSSNFGVLRVPILYGDVQFVRESAVTGLLPILQETKSQVKVSNYELRCPTYVNDVASVIHQILLYREQHPDFYGVWHWSGDEQMTKYAMIKNMAEVFNLPMEHVKPDNEPSKGAVRPYNAELDCSVLENVGIKKRTPFKEGIKECLKSFL